MHSVFGDYAAATIGWAQSPFQLELAMSSLGIGVMAFILGRRGAPLIGKVALVIAVRDLRIRRRGRSHLPDARQS